MSWDDMHERNLRQMRGGPGWLGWIIGGVVAFIVALLIIAFLFVERVDATESCAVTSFGKILTNTDGTPQLAGPGLHVMAPDKSLICYSVKRKTMELVAGDPAQSNSKADYVDWAIKARTKDGIDLYSMLTAQYHVTPECAGKLFPLITDDEGVKEQVVKARLRSVVPQVLSNYDAITQYRGNITAISDDVATQLDAELASQCVELDYFELKRGDFDDAYETSIRARSLEVESAEKKKLEQLTATEEAKRLAIETDAAAAKRKTEADANAYVQRTETDAAVYNLEQRAAALRENPSLIEWEQVQAIRDAGAVYLPSGALPIYSVPQVAPTPVG